MRAMPGQPRRTSRLRRLLGLDGNPLRRASDRAEAWIRIGLLVVLAAGGPLAAIGAGQWAYHTGMTAVREDAARTHHVHAVVLPPTAAAVRVAGFPEERRVRVRITWAGTGASSRTDTMLLPVGSPTGSMVSVWVNASGRLTAPPLEPGQVRLLAVTAAVMTLVLVPLVLLALLRLIQWLLIRWRLARWDAAWSTVEPRWTRREP